MPARTAPVPNEPHAAAALSAAACATRTGLTTRALRIYERRGLITPPRTEHGWRRYGEHELTRLNSIALLKLAGLTLSQIHAVLIAGREPTLEQLLRAQLQDWQARKTRAEMGQHVASSVLQRLQSAQAVPLDELCLLIRSALTDSSISPLHRFTQHIIERSAQSGVQEAGLQLARLIAADDAAQVQVIATYQEVMRRSIDPQLEQLQQQGVEPWDEAVQAVLRQHQRLLVQYRVREITMRRLMTPIAADSDARCVELQRQVRAEMLEKLKQRPTANSDLLGSQWTTNPFLIDFFSRAELHSEQCRQIDALLADCGRSLQLQPDPTSREVRALAGRLRRLCRKFQLGDALTFAKWAALVRPAPAGMSDLEDKACWMSMISTLSCRTKRTA